MARVYADSQGRIVGVRKNLAELPRAPAPPEAAQFLDLDQDTNQALYTALRGRQEDFRLRAGVLRDRGNVVSLNAAGPQLLQRQEVDRLDQLLSRLDQPAALTPAELKAGLRRLCLVLKHMARLLRDKGEDI